MSPMATVEPLGLVLRWLFRSRLPLSESEVLPVLVVAVETAVVAAVVVVVVASQLLLSAPC